MSGDRLAMTLEMANSKLNAPNGASSPQTSSRLSAEMECSKSTNKTFPLHVFFAASFRIYCKKLTDFAVCRRSSVPIKCDEDRGHAWLCLLPMDPVFGCCYGDYAVLCD